MVQGLDRLQRKLTVVIPEAVKAAAADALEKNANDLVALMRRLVPVDRGALRDSIGWTWGDAPAGTMVVGTVGARTKKKRAAGASYEAMRITVYAGGGDEFYAWFQEFGTVNMPANPFFFPAYRMKRRAMKASLTKAVKRAVQQGAG